MRDRRQSSAAINSRRRLGQLYPSYVRSLSSRGVAVRAGFDVARMPARGRRVQTGVILVTRRHARPGADVTRNALADAWCTKSRASEAAIRGIVVEHPIEVTIVEHGLGAAHRVSVLARKVAAVGEARLAATEVRGDGRRTRRHRKIIVNLVIAIVVLAIARLRRGEDGLRARLGAGRAARIMAYRARPESPGDRTHPSGNARRFAYAGEAASRTTVCADRAGLQVGLASSTEFRAKANLLVAAATVGLHHAALSDVLAAGAADSALLGACAARMLPGVTVRVERDALVAIARAAGGTGVALVDFAEVSARAVGPVQGRRAGLVAEAAEARRAGHARRALRFCRGVVYVVPVGVTRIPLVDADGAERGGRRAGPADVIALAVRVRGTLVLRGVTRAQDRLSERRKSALKHPATPIDAARSEVRGAHAGRLAFRLGAGAPERDGSNTHVSAGDHLAGRTRRRATGRIVLAWYPRLLDLGDVFFRRRGAACCERQRNQAGQGDHSKERGQDIRLGRSRGRALSCVSFNRRQLRKLLRTRNKMPKRSVSKDGRHGVDAGSASRLNHIVQRGMASGSRGATLHESRTA